MKNLTLILDWVQGVALIWIGILLITEIPAKKTFWVWGLLCITFGLRTLTRGSNGSTKPVTRSITMGVVAVLLLIPTSGCDKQGRLLLIAPTVDATWQINNNKNSLTEAGYSGPGNVGTLGTLGENSWTTWTREFDVPRAQDLEVDINLNFSDYVTHKVRTMSGRVSCCRYVRVFVVSDGTFHKLVVLDDSLGIRDVMLANAILNNAEQFSETEMLQILRSVPLEQAKPLLAQRNTARRISKAMDIQSTLNKLGSSTQPFQYYLEVAIASGEMTTQQATDFYKKMATN